MSTKVSKTNPYLRDPAVREKMVIRSVVTSSAIEGIRVSFTGSRQSRGEEAAALNGRASGEEGLATDLLHPSGLLAALTVTLVVDGYDTRHRIAQAVPGGRTAATPSS